MHKLTSIVDVFNMRPHVFQPLVQFTEQLMRSPGALTQLERELIATATSGHNDCEFCYRSHMAVVDHLLESAGRPAVPTAREEALIDVAVMVRQLQNPWTDKRILDVLTDEEIHDAASVAAAFNMFNRLVEAHGIEAASPEHNAAIGRHLAEHGYAAAATHPAHG